jgi:hypothetical protein
MPRRTKAKNPISVTEGYKDVKKLIREVVRDVKSVTTATKKKNKQRRKKQPATMRFKQTVKQSLPAPTVGGGGDTIRVAGKVMLLLPQDNEVALQLGAPVASVYPTLAAYFLAYDGYRFNGGAIEYVPLCPATTTGYTTVCVVEDPLAVVSLSSLALRPDSVSFPVWQAGITKIPPSRWLETGYGSDLRDTAAFTLYMSSTAYGLGQWWFHYSFDFSERRAVPKPLWNSTHYTDNAYYRVTYIDAVAAAACVSFEANSPAISDGKYVSLRSSAGVPVALAKGTLIQAFIDGILGLEPTYDGIPITIGQVLYFRIAERLATLAGANTQVSGTTSYIEQASLDAAGTKKVSFTGASTTYITLQGILTLAP